MIGIMLISLMLASLLQTISGAGHLWNSLKLPTNLVPIHYEIRIRPDTDTLKTEGLVEMTLRVKEPTNLIVFHADHIIFRSVLVTYSHGYQRRVALNNNKCPGEYAVDEGGNNGRFLKKINQTDHKEYQQYQIQLDEQLIVNRLIVVRVGFTSSLVGQGVGFYKTDFTVDGAEKMVLSTNFKAGHARRAFPCLDEPELKATYKLWMGRKKDHIARFNAEVYSTGPYRRYKGMVIDTFKTSVCLAIDQLGIVIADGYTSIKEKTSGGLVVTLFAPQDKIINAKYALTSAVAILQKHNTYFGIPLKKLDMVAIPNMSPDFIGSWGLVMYRESSLLVDTTAIDESKKKVAKAVSDGLDVQ